MMKVATLLLLVSAWLGAQTGGAEGIIVDHESGKPLSGVHVRLVGMESGAAGGVYGAMSDAGGHFSVGTMQPGVYAVLPILRGFVLVKAGATDSHRPTLTLKAGQHVTDYQVELSRRAVISGRVIDELGDAVPYVPVNAEPVSGAAFLLSGTSNSITTDDRGEYRIPGAPGKYYVSARPQGRLAFLDGTAQVAATYYPSAGNKGDAEVVETKPGSEISGIDIQLTQATRQQVFSIRGVVRGAGSEQATVRLQTLDGAGRNTGSRMRIIGADGKFWFDKLAPGGYRLSASGSSGATWLFSAPADLKLDGADIANLVLVLEPGGELAGTLETVGMAPGPPPPGKLTVRLAPVVTGGFAEETTADVDAKGAFRLSGVAPGRFRIQVDGLPENACVASVVLDGKAASDGLFDVVPGMHGSKLRVAVDPNGAKLSGVVRDKNGSPVAYPASIVILTDKLEFPLDAKSYAFPAADGTYRFQGLHPGKYRIVSLALAGASGEARQEAIRKLLAETGEIEIKAGDRLTKDFIVAARENANDKPKQ
jgi:hypothetical protein